MYTDEEIKEHADFRYKIMSLQRERNNAAQRAGRLTQKGHSSYSSPCDNPGYYDALSSVRVRTKELATLLHEPLIQSRQHGSSWKQIAFYYGLTTTTLKAIRQHRICRDLT